VESPFGEKREARNECAERKREGGKNCHSSGASCVSLNDSVNESQRESPRSSSG
jgi:hypothetical protein